MKEKHRCYEEIKDNFDEHLHGYSYLMTYMPIKLSEAINQKEEK